MEDIVDQLREFNEDIPVPLELPDRDDLVLVEEQLLISLPADYKEFLLTVSDVVCGAIEPATAMDPQSHVYLPEMASLAWDIGVPRELIPVCELNGNYYCIQQDGEIVYWTPAGLTEEVWESIWDWAQDIWIGSRYRGGA